MQPVSSASRFARPASDAKRTPLASTTVLATAARVSESRRAMPKVASNAAAAPSRDGTIAASGSGIPLRCAAAAAQKNRGGLSV